MIKSNILQFVPGTMGTEVYPYIRKIDLMSSNSYILSAEEQIAVIDPGALEDRLDVLVGKINALLEKKPRPVVVYLTHAHLDHCFQLKRLSEINNLGYILVAAQETGADALEKQDSKLTLAGLLGKKMASVPVDIRLLSRQDLVVGGERQIELDGVKFTYHTRSFRIGDSPVIDSQIISLGKDDQLEVYSIPGHSPDSICIRAGRLLFTGDLFFAPNSGVAGAYGWSQSNLLTSIQKVLYILEQKNILFCCSGHGSVVDADTAWMTLKSMYQDVLSLSDLEEITPEWARNTADYAEDLMTELERLFTIILARLAYISHVFDELGERDEADGLQALLDLYRIEELFAEFNKFVLELHAGRKLDWDLVHKAGQIIGRLDKVLEGRKIGSVLSRSIIQRANRMLNDYTVIYRGFRPPYYATDVDINGLLKETLDYLLRKPYDEAAIIEADDYEEYLWALRARISHINIFEKIALELKDDKSLPSARMDKERFNEAIIDLLERLPSAGAKGIRIVTSSNDGWISVRIIVSGDYYEHPLGERTLRFFEREFALCGGIIQTYVTGEGPVIEIEFLTSKSY